MLLGPETSQLSPLNEAFLPVDIETPLLELKDVVEPSQSKELDNVELLNEPPLPEDLHDVDPFQSTDIGQSSRPANSELLLTPAPPELLEDINPLLSCLVFEPLDEDYDWSLDPFPLDPIRKRWIFQGC